MVSDAAYLLAKESFRVGGKGLEYDGETILA
jgi:hypothetical protein